MQRYLTVDMTHSGTSGYLTDWDERSTASGVLNFQSRLSLAEDKALIQIKPNIATAFSGSLAASQPFILGRFDEQGARDEMMSGWTAASGNEWIPPAT